jgi:uncharacterized OsmC-like protein
MTMQTEVKANVVNGLDVDKAVATIQAIQADPEIAQFQFRARNKWIGGGGEQVVDQGLLRRRGRGHLSSHGWEFTNGEPPILLGENEGANPVEYLLHSLAGCITTTFVLHAAARGLVINTLSTELEGDLDVHGLLGMNEAVFPGYREIRVKMHVDAECSDEELNDLLDFTKAHSPVCNTVCKPVPVLIERVV